MGTGWACAGPLVGQALGGFAVNADAVVAGRICGHRAGWRHVQIAARHADPRTTTVYDHRRQNLDKHAAYVVVAFVAGG